MPALGLALALIIGSLLGLLGGGGSILAVPVFVYVLGLDPKIAIATSLAVVGITSLVGVLPHHRAGNLDLRRALLFGAGSSAGAFLGALASELISGSVQMILFASMMLVAAFFMFRGRRSPASPPPGRPSRRAMALMIVQGIGVGLLTGLIGVGGGFMIVPALVLLGGVEMRRAVGTSLFVIGVNAIFGVAGYLAQPAMRLAIARAEIGGFPLPGFLVMFTLVTIVGVFLGAYGTRLVNPVVLRRAFAVFLILVSGYILALG